jgi:hypothetical protein
MKSFWNWVSALLFVWLFVQLGRVMLRDSAKGNWGHAAMLAIPWLVSVALAAWSLSAIFPTR